MALKQLIKVVTPVTALRAYRSFRGRWDRDDLLFNADAHRGPLVGVFDQIRAIPGYFTYDDCVAFTLVLGAQTAAGLTGDVFEIGSYHGRSTAVIARLLQPDERLVICETFDMAGGDDYPNPPTSDDLRRNLRRLAPQARLEIIQSYSTALSLPPDQRFRFIHIDGGHRYDVALSDLRLSARHLQSGGLIVLDDYHSPIWPEVTSAADAFLAERSDIQIVADVNRYGDSGRKLYLRCQA